MRESPNLIRSRISQTAKAAECRLAESVGTSPKAKWMPALLVMVACLSLQVAPAQNWRNWTLGLSDDFVKSGPGVLDAFRPVAAATRASVVILAVDGWRAALGTIVDTNGLVITKASELKAGKLTCTLASGQEVAGQIVATDDDNDVVLVKISGKGLKPIAWASGETTVGQWVATPGLGTAPEAVGIVSVHPRKILPKQAFIGVRLSTNESPAMIESVMPGFGAAQAGLKGGDVILSVNGVTTAKREELVNTLREFRAGKTVKLRVKREDAEFDAEVEMMAESTVQAANRAQFGGRRGFGRGGGRGFGPGIDRQDRMNRMGSDVSQRAEEFDLAIQHDTVLEPWQCGGPLVNLDGKAVGINIARAGRVASYALPASLAERIVEDLKAQAGITANGK
jgi:serine protease Do